MKVCVSLRDPADTDLRKGNFRTEPRWERLALEACVSNPEITEIYTLGYDWRGGCSVTSKYKGVLRSSPTDCVLLMQDWNHSTINSHRFKAAVVNIFHGPWIEQKAEIDNVRAKLNNNVFFVLGHPTLYEDIALKRTGSKMSELVSIERILSLPVPWVPESRYQDRFEIKNLLFAARLITVSQMGTFSQLLWALESLLADTSLHLTILNGWKPGEAKDLVAGKMVPVADDITNHFWQLEKFKPYQSVRDRVKIRSGLDWSEVLEENAKAKLLLTSSNYGGSPMEAAMHGLPFVGIPLPHWTFRAGSMVSCPGFLWTESVEEMNATLSRLLTDRDFYTETALKYHDYAMETYSFDAFNNNLNQLLKSHGVI